MTQEALKLALEALELNNKEWKSLADSGDAGYWKAEDQDHYKQTEEAITAIKEELAETQYWNEKYKLIVQEVQEHPPQRTWVGLTNNEIALINADFPLPQGFAKAIEAKLKELNT